MDRGLPPLSLRVFVTRLPRAWRRLLCFSTSGSAMDLIDSEGKNKGQAGDKSLLKDLKESNIKGAMCAPNEKSVKGEN